MDSEKGIVEMNERLSNIEAKLDFICEHLKSSPAPAAKKTRAPNDKGGATCQYVKRNKELCDKPAKADTNYCSDHPEGMTRSAYNKKKESGEVATPTPSKATGPTITFEEMEDDLQIITKPTIYKGIITSTDQPHKFYFQTSGDKEATRISPSATAQLEKNKMIAASEEEQEAMLEQLGRTWKVKRTPADTKAAAAATETKRKAAAPRIQLDDDSEEEEEEEKPKPKPASRAPPKKPVAADPDSEEEEEEEKPKPKRATKRPDTDDESD